MKLRQGFVSNSSSSSFIIGVGKITDINKFRSYVEANNIKLDYNFNIKSKFDLLNERSYSIKANENKVSLESFIYSEVSLDISGLSPLDMIAIFDYGGGDDSDFWDGDDYNYDIDYTHFDQNEQCIMDMFSDEKSGIEVSTSEISFGAGRDG